MINIAAIGSLLQSATPPVGTLPAPSLATDGVDISSWNVGTAQRIAFDAATVYLSGDGAATLTGPVNIWGFRNSKWWLLGTLDTNGNIPITGPNQGSARRVDQVAVFSRLAASCTTVTGGVTYTYGFEPISIRYD